MAYFITGGAIHGPGLQESPAMQRPLTPQARGGNMTMLHFNSSSPRHDSRFVIGKENCHQDSYYHRYNSRRIFNVAHILLKLNLECLRLGLLPRTSFESLSRDTNDTYLQVSFDHCKRNKVHIPQAGRGPALPVLRDSSLSPLPRSSVPACTTTVRYTQSAFASLISS